MRDAALTAARSAPHGHFVNGEWRAFDGRSRPIIDPANGEIITEIGYADEATVDAAVSAARHAAQNSEWAGTPPLMRERIMNRLADLMERDAATLAALETLDVGKPFSIASAVDIPAAIGWMRYMAGWASKHEGRLIRLSSHPDGYHAYTMKEPNGVAGLITPWNYPLVLAIWKVAPALAAGCTVVLKPSEVTPLSTMHLAKLAKEAGIPRGVLNIVYGDGSGAGAALVEHPGVDKIAFTGSTRVGGEIAAKCGRSFKRVSLELGGKSPAFIFDDANLEEAIPGVLQNGFFNTGQSCFAGTRLFVQEAIYNDVRDALLSAVGALKVGAGFEPETMLGPMVSETQRDRVSAMVERAKSNGAKALCGGEPKDGPGYFYEPTLLCEVDEQSEIFQEEVFGPVICISPFKDEEDATRLANATKYGLCGYVWTGDAARGHRLAKEIKSGGIWVNCHTIVDPALPFGGFKQSGVGRENGPEALDQYTEVKSVCVKL